MKMYQHLDDVTNSSIKTAFNFQRKGVCKIPKNLIGWLLLTCAGLLIWLCCHSLSKCIFNRWQLLKDQIFWTTIIVITWYWLASLFSLPTPHEKSSMLRTTEDYLKKIIIRYLNPLLQVLKKLGINKNTK